MRALLLMLLTVPTLVTAALCPSTLHPSCKCVEELDDRISVYCSSIPIETALSPMEGLSLERLQLTNCSMASTETPFKFTSLKVLEIDNCGLTTFNDQSLNSITLSLEELLLPNNKLTSVPLLRSLPRLVSLSLNDNLINDLPEGSFDGLPKLRQLRVRNNKICTLSSNSLNETKNSLELLDLSRNCLGAVPAPALRNSQRLTYLDLSSNKIAEIGNFNVMNLPRLRELQLNDNILNKIHPMAFMNVPELQFLYMRNNLISNLDGNRLQAFSKLEILDARNNMLSKLPSFKDQPNLKEIRLDGNLIAKVETLAFTSNPRLQLISLQDNAISVVARNSFDSLDRLVVLLLSNNSIKSIDRGMLDGMKNLQQLNMRNNSIAEVDKDSFAPLKLLTTLDLGYNQLKTIGPGTFDVMSKLFWLDLSGNLIRTIKKGVFTKRISNIVLDGNPLECDDELDGFVHFLVVNKVRTFLPAQPEITCAGPAGMEGKQFKDLMMKKANETKEVEKPKGNQQFLNSILPALSIGGLGANPRGGAPGGGLAGLGDLSALTNALPGLKAMLGVGGGGGARAAPAAPQQRPLANQAPTAPAASAGVPNINLAALSQNELETLIGALPPMSVNVPGYGELDLPPSLVAHVLKGGQIPGVPKEALDQSMTKYIGMMRQMVSDGLRQQQQQPGLATSQRTIPQLPTPVAAPTLQQQQESAAATHFGQPSQPTTPAAPPSLPLSPQTLEMLKMLPAGYNISRIPMEASAVMTAISRGEVPDLNLLPHDLQTHLMSNSNQMLTMFSKNGKGGTIDELLAKLPKWERPDLPTFSPYDINDIHNELVQEEEAAARQAQLRIYSAIALAAIGTISIFVVALLCYCNRKNAQSAPLHRPLQTSSATCAQSSFLHHASSSMQAV